VSQSRFDSFKEAFVNTGIGFVMSLVLQIILAWWYDTNLTLVQNVQITIWFTILSIARSYVVRRWFNRKYVKSSGYEMTKTFTVPGCSVPLQDHRKKDRHIDVASATHLLS
jgi:hypothetical protein